VTSRGDRREAIYRDDEDRGAQLNVIAQAMARFDAQVLAYCQVGNHYRLVRHTGPAWGQVFHFSPEGCPPVTARPLRMDTERAG
jgi:hypothetical protein